MKGSEIIKRKINLINEKHNKNIQQINKRIDNLEIETSQLSQSIGDSFNYHIEQLQKELDDFQTTTEEEIETIYFSLDTIDEQLKKLKKIEELKRELNNICKILRLNIVMILLKLIEK